MKEYVFVFGLLALSASGAVAQEPALLLFDGESGQTFAGCLNCNKFDDAAVCNKYGDYGSKYEDSSIWNAYGEFGSKYEKNSPWNKSGEGLRIVDLDGNYYGRFTLSNTDHSRLPIVISLVKLYEAFEDLDKLRDFYCEQ
jgi:hypothetical protein